MRDNLVTNLVLLAMAAVAILLTGCSGGTSSIDDGALPATSAGSSTTDVAPTTSVAATSLPTTTVETTTTTELLRPDLNRSIAFLDACVPNDPAIAASLAGPCRCALGEVARVVADSEWELLEDRIVAEQDLPAVIVTAMEPCRDASAPVIDDLQRVRLDGACAGVAGHTDDSCQCAVDRAVQIVPGDLIDDFAAAVDREIVPSMADLVRRCLAA